MIWQTGMHKDKIRDECIPYLKYILMAMVSGIIVYFSLMSNDLINNLDGIWHPSNFIAGDWEISLGRGLQRYADRARFGLVTSSWNSIIVYFLIGLADSLIICKYKLRDTFFSYLFVFITIANPVICESLTYSYMSVNFGLAYFFSTLAFFLLPEEYAIAKERVRALALSALAFAISMAFYQAYICLFAVLSLFGVILLVIERKEVKRIGAVMANVIAVGLFGGILYWIITKLLLLRAGIELASYRGANSIGLFSIIKSFPQSIVNAINENIKYIFIERLHTAGLEFSGLVIVCLAVVLGIVAVIRVVEAFKADSVTAILLIILLALLPIASTCICIIAVGNEISGLMAMGILMAILMFSLLVKNRKWTSVIMNIALIALAWYLVSAVEKDQIALKEGINATKVIAEKSVSDIYTDYSFDDYKTVAFVGRAAENPLFYKSLTYETANGYAQFGRWSTDARNNMVTWTGIMEMLCGTELPICGVGDYEKIVRSEEIKEMPTYPEKGYMQIVDNVLVIKISNLY